MVLLRTGLLRKDFGRKIGACLGSPLDEASIVYAEDRIAT
jgi:hypothetical protein